MGIVFYLQLQLVYSEVPWKFGYIEYSCYHFTTQGGKCQW